MDNLKFDLHLTILIVIMFFSGAFGGYLNYLHNFDTAENESKEKLLVYKYVLLGVGAAFLVPAFLNMISSSLIKTPSDNINYLIFTGFCLIASIFSRRFITTISERLLEKVDNIERKANQAEKKAQESNQKANSTQVEVTTTREQIKNVRLAVDIQNTDVRSVEAADIDQLELLFELANTYVEKTSIPDFLERFKLKSELGRKMASIILVNNFSKSELIKKNQSEGMLLAIAYSIQIRPTKDDIFILNQIVNLTIQKFTKGSILVAYEALARNSYINKDDAKSIYNLITGFRNNADKSLIDQIDHTITSLSLINPDVKK